MRGKLSSTRSRAIGAKTPRSSSRLSDQFGAATCRAYRRRVSCLWCMLLVFVRDPPQKPMPPVQPTLGVNRRSGATVPVNVGTSRRASPSFPMLAFLRAGSTPSTRYQPPLVTIVTRATHSEPKAVALPIHSLRERKNYTKASLFMRETFFVGSHCPRCPPALVSPSAAALYSAVIDLRPVSPETD